MSEFSTYKSMAANPPPPNAQPPPLRGDDADMSSSSASIPSDSSDEVTESTYSYDPDNWAGIHFLYMSKHDWVSRVIVNYCAFGIIFFALLWRYRLAQSPAGLVLSLLAAMMFWGLQVFFWWDTKFENS